MINDHSMIVSGNFSTDFGDLGESKKQLAASTDGPTYAS
jgi:hypothetical protein